MSSTHASGTRVRRAIFVTTSSSFLQFYSRVFEKACKRIHVEECDIFREKLFNGNVITICKISLPTSDTKNISWDFCFVASSWTRFFISSSARRRYLHRRSVPPHRRPDAGTPYGNLVCDRANLTGLVLGCIEAKFCK